MKVLVTGATGYIGSQLAVELVKQGHEVVVLVRDRRRLPSALAFVDVIEGDLLNQESLQGIPKDCEAVYYLVHSMKERAQGFEEMEELSARNLIDALKGTGVRQVIYLGGLSYGKDQSEHMRSRENVARVLQKSGIPVTVLRAGIVIGRGSASFTIMVDLVRSLPIMITPRWVESKCQPIFIGDVIFYLIAVLGNEACLNGTFDVVGEEVMTYREMLLELARHLGLKRWIIRVPVLTPKLSSYWLYFVTGVSFPLAQALVKSLKTDAVSRGMRLDEVIPHRCLSFNEALRETDCGVV